MKKITIILLFLASMTGFAQNKAQIEQLKRPGTPTQFSNKSLIILTKEGAGCEDLSDVDRNAELAKRHLITEDIYDFINKAFWGNKTPYEIEVTKEDIDKILASKKCFVIFNPTDAKTTTDIMDFSRITFSDTFDILNSCYPVKMFKHLKDKASYVGVTKGRKIILKTEGDFGSQEIRTIVLFDVAYGGTTYSLYDIVEDPNH